MKTLLRTTGLAVVVLASASFAFAGPYSGGQSDPTNPHDAGIPGFVDSGGSPVVNPLFIGWATGYLNYAPPPPADPPYDSTEYLQRRGVAMEWQVPERALGQVTGDTMDVVSLGDLYQDQIDASIPPGEITLTFARPIANRDGKDFAVFENGFIEATSGKVWAELGYVEVSTNGVDFARFPSVSLTPGLVGPYGTVDPTGIYNLAGKHVNNNSSGGPEFEGSFGTPFDLDDLLDHVMVIGGQVDLGNINYVKIVDVPGSGDYDDEAMELVDPDNDPLHYSEDHPIYDGWVTWGSGGFDLEAVGIMNGALDGDANADGVVDILDLNRLSTNWGSTAANWSEGDFNGDNHVDILDLNTLTTNWGNHNPEPATTALLAVGVLGLLRRRRRLC
ncbi:MAG: PEP-CTERM sorting domain-containing protein [Phycisphaerae bacterium]|nr:PEP-CTERM sorting domain-containing protein [Phycisphaerae bacterium]